MFLITSKEKKYMTVLMLIWLQRIILMKLILENSVNF